MWSLRMATERRVNGLRIEATERVESPLSGHIRGNPDAKIYYTQMMKALLEDESEVYICTAPGCGHFEETSKSLQAHTRAKHSKSGKKAGGAPAKKKEVAKKAEPVAEEPAPTRKRDVPHKDLMAYIMGLPMREVIELATQGQQAEDFIMHLRKELEETKKERDQYKERLDEITRVFRAMGVGK